MRGMKLVWDVLILYIVDLLFSFIGLYLPGDVSRAIVAGSVKLLSVTANILPLRVGVTGSSI